MGPLATSALGRRFANPLLNASGVWCQTDAELDDLVGSDAGSLITKSCTLAPRSGNPEPRYVDTLLGSINSMGLPNAGFQHYLGFAVGHDHDRKPLFLSLSGLSVAENVTMLTALREAGPPVLVELNLSCPNVPGRPQLGYDFPGMHDALTAAAAAYGRPFGVKLPPYFDHSHFDEAAAVLTDVPEVAFLTCINSIGNGLVIDVETESVVIRPKGGFGGIGGDYVLPTALANVNAFHRRCPDKVIVGCGGVRTGEQVFQHLLAGASLVQVGTALHQEGPQLFTRLASELADLLDRKGYRSVTEVVGALRTL